MTLNDMSLQLIRCKLYEGDASWNYHDVVYPYNTLYFAIGGDGWVSDQVQQIALKPGHVYLIPAGLEFSCWCETHVSKVYADVNLEIVPGYDLFSGAGGIRELEYGMPEIARISEACGRGSLKDIAYLNGVIWNVLAEFLDERMKPPDYEMISFKPVLDDIKRHLSVQLKVAEIARRHHFNPVVLSRKFKKVFGSGMKEYIERLLVSQLQLQLIYSGYSMKELAERYGFCDQYYFSSFFKKHTGFSPTAYRDKMVQAADYPFADSEGGQSSLCVSCKSAHLEFPLTCAD